MNHKALTINLKNLHLHAIADQFVEIARQAEHQKLKAQSDNFSLHLSQYFISASKQIENSLAEGQVNADQIQLPLCQVLSTHHSQRGLACPSPPA